MSKKRLLYTTLFLIQSVIVYGQKGYFATDSLISVGVRIVDGGPVQNSKFCRVGVKNQTIKYSPDEVKEYGINMRKIYISKRINVDDENKRVFLERLAKGSINLYSYKYKKGQKLFLERDSGQLLEILKTGNDIGNYKDLLKSFTQDCNKVTESVKLASFNKLSLTKLIDQYNSCIEKPFPFTRYGLALGYTISNLYGSKMSDEVLKKAIFENDISFNYGVFIDVPIFLSYFSIHPEIYYKRNSFLSHFTSYNNVNDIIINATSINIPLLIRYSYPSLKLRPFVNIGSTFSYNYRNENMAYTAIISNNIVEINEIYHYKIYSDKLFGYTIGSGIQYNIDFKRSLFVELRYNSLRGMTFHTYENKNLGILLGINL